MGSVNEELRDRAIAHAVAIIRYGQGISDKIVRLLNSADDKLIEKLGARLAAIDERGYDTGPATTKKINKLLDELGAINAAVYAKVSDALVTELQDFAVAEAGFQQGSLEASIGTEIGTALPSPKVLRALVTETPMEGKLLSAYTKGMEAGRLDRISQAIRVGIVNGDSTDAIVRTIRGTKAAGYSNGILDISRRSAQSIVRTAVTHVSNVAAQETWAENSAVVKAWQFMATLDSRTTITCAALSGQTFPLGQGPIPPRHIRCRSISIPVTKSFRELGVNADELPKGKRASMDGAVAGNTTFSSWLVQKGAATQDTILGKTRAELFRAGKLDLNQFIRNDGTILSLDQLKSKYGDLLGR